VSNAFGKTRRGQLSLPPEPIAKFLDQRSTEAWSRIRNSSIHRAKLPELTP